MLVGLQTGTTTLEINLEFPQKIGKSNREGHMFHYIHGGLISDSQKLESTQMTHKGRMDTENVVYLYNEILLSC